LPVGVLRGVGSRTRPKLERLGTHTVADLRGWPPAALQDLAGPRLALDLYRQAHGIASDRIGERALRKSLSRERTFGQDVADVGAVRANLVELAQQVAAAARQEGLAGRVLRLKIRFHGFETHTRQRQLGWRCHEPVMLTAAAWSLYENGDWHGRPIRRGSGASKDR
jgi:DNA polymerase-4